MKVGLDVLNVVVLGVDLPDLRADVDALHARGVVQVQKLDPVEMAELGFCVVKLEHHLLLCGVWCKGGNDIRQQQQRQRRPPMDWFAGGARPAGAWRPACKVG